jgi:hypothetical protein
VTKIPHEMDSAGLVGAPAIITQARPTIPVVNESASLPSAILRAVFNASRPLSDPII